MAYLFFERNLMNKMHMLFIYGTLIKYFSDVVLFETRNHWVFWMNAFTIETKSQTYLHSWFGILPSQTQILRGSNTILRLISIL